MGATNLIEEMEIDGVIDFGENKVTEEEFFEMFVDWIEGNKWHFGGKIAPYEEHNEASK